MRHYKPTIHTYFIYAIMILIAVGSLYPLLYVIASSFSSADAVAASKVWLWPIDFTLDAYKKVFSDPQIFTGYANSIFITAVGTLINVVLTISGAYPLSKKKLRGRKLMMIMITFTMWFQPGMIPVYLNIRDLGLIDKRLSVLIAFGCAAFYLILLRTYFQSVPESIEESAKIDGAGHMTILTKIILPLSKPALATIALYYAVGRWNGYFWSMILLRDENKVPLQVVLRKLIIETTVNQELVSDLSAKVSEQTIIFAAITVSVIPVLVFYPFIQKYFEKGIMIGSVKG